MKVLAITNSELPIDESLDLLLNQLQERQVEYSLVDYNDPVQKSTLEVYDILTTPALLITQDDGSVIQLWQGPMPTVDLVINYAMGNV
ncbi:MAG: hypothetical protein WCH00_01160 [Candidatus Saccharibacteria bacterium]